MTPARLEAGSPADADDRLWGGRRWTAIGAVLFVVVVAALAVFALLAKGDPAQPGDALSDGGWPARRFAVARALLRRSPAAVCR